MRKILILVILALPYSLMAAVPNATIDRVLSALESYNPYRVEIEVIYAGDSLHGFYEVDDSKYYISIDQQELYGDKEVKYEVFNGRREVVVDAVSSDFSGNLLNNPATAFDSIRDHYLAEEISDVDGVTTLKLTTESSDEVIELAISKKSMMPLSLVYKMGDEEVLIRIVSIKHLESAITLYSSDKYSDYEVIDFR